MFMNQFSKNISVTIRQHAQSIRSGLHTAFEVSILGCQKELQFLNNLLSQIGTYLNSLSIPGVQFSVRQKLIHQKPLVNTQNGRCEIGDLLIIVKYHQPTGAVETKSIIYQVKLCRSGTHVCNISQPQLNLLCEWPQFSFGSATYNVTPQFLEFGSYMLEPRNAAPGNYLPHKYQCYGISPDAPLVRAFGPAAVNITSLVYARGDANNFFSHLIFEIGEHHNNQTVKNLIDALYRYMGWLPDPPNEFKEDYIEYKDDGFGIIEVNVKGDISR